MDQQQVDSERRRQRIRRAAFLCIHTLSNVACFRAGCDVEEFHLHRHFYGRAHNNFLDTSVMKWCMLFADENSKHHAFKVVSDKDRFTRELLAQLKMTWGEFEAYGKMLRTARDEFIAHLDDVQRAPMPMLDAVVESAAFTLLYLHRHEGKNADLADVPPPGHPDKTIFTFWDYFRDAYGRDAGLRIDHLLLNAPAAARLASAAVDRHVRGWERASDHAPTWIELREAAPAV